MPEVGEIAISMVVSALLGTILLSVTSMFVPSLKDSTIAFLLAWVILVCLFGGVALAVLLGLRAVAREL